MLTQLIGPNVQLHHTKMLVKPPEQAVASKLALATVADWLRAPGAYDAVASYERALRAYGAEAVEALRVLVSAPAEVPPVADVEALVDALALGVDAATGLALLEPFA